MKNKKTISTLHTLLVDLMPPIKQRVISSVKNCIVDFTPNGSMNSYALTQAINTGYLKINDEINNVILLLEKIISKSEDIEILRKDLHPFVEELFQLVHVAAKETIRDDSVMSKILQMPYEERVKEAKAFLEVMLNTEKLRIKREQSIRVWDVFKLIISAVLGAVFALLVQSIL